MSPERLRSAGLNILAIGLVAWSGAYIYDIGRDSFDQLQRSGLGISGFAWIVLTLGVLGTLVLTTIYHVVETRRIESRALPATTIGLAYALGQIVRYIPGKLIGVLYQLRFLSGKLRASTITLALIVQTIYDYLWTFAFAGAILLCATLRSAWPLAVLVPVIFGLWWAHRQGWCERILVLPGPIRRRFPELDSGRLDARTCAGRATLVLVLVWIPMLLGIVVALGGMLAPGAALLIGAAYLLAAVGSLLIIVVPSGLVVREALFVWIGSRYGFEPAMLLFVGLVLRVALTLGEVLNVLVFLGADSMRERLRIQRPERHDTP